LLVTARRDPINTNAAKRARARSEQKIQVVAAAIIAEAKKCR
jgi:hypothetical protein